MKKGKKKVKYAPATIREILDKVAEYGYLAVDDLGRARLNHYIDQALSSIREVFEGMKKDNMGLNEVEARISIYVNGRIEGINACIDKCK